MGVDIANVVGHVGRIIAHKDPVRQLLVDGDLLTLVKILVLARSAGNVAISKVKGHADDDLVRRGQVREADKFGNDMADEAADFGRRRVGEDVLDARREFARACRTWYPVVRDLHRFFIAIARVFVNEDGKGVSWCSGAKGKRRRVIDAVQDFAMIPGPQSLWSGSWVRWPVIAVSGDDVGRWPCSPDALVKLAAFLSSLSWPGEVSDLGPVESLSLSFLFCMKDGLLKSFVLRMLFLSILGLDVQFRCQLHPCALISIFGGFVSILVV